MRYALLVTLREELGTVARLLLLLNQRGLHPEALSVARGANGRLIAVIQLGGTDSLKARWAARQLRRMRSVEASRVLDESELRQWVRLRVPAAARQHPLPEGATWQVVGEEGDHLLVEVSGPATAVHATAAITGAEVLLSLLEPPLDLQGQPHVIHGRRPIINGRKVVVRQGRGSRLA